METRLAKKRLMFLAGEDFYYFTYSILLALDYLGCKEGRYFKDYRKLPFVIDFLGDSNLVYILASTQDIAERDRPKNELNRIDTEYLFKSYANGVARRSEILKLLFTLERKGYVSLQKGDLQSAVNVSLNPKNLPLKFLDRSVFEKEYRNAEQLRMLVKRLSTLTLDTMLKKLYDDRGVRTWAL